MQDLRKQLSEARNIKQEIIERGQSANLKVDLLNDELEDTRVGLVRSKKPWSLLERPFGCCKEEDRGLQL